MIMKKIILFFSGLLYFMVVFCQSTELTNEEIRHFKRAGIAIKMAKEAEDYKEAISEYEKVLETATKDADVWYRLAVCCEAAAQADNSYYRRAADAYRKSLSYGASLLDADKKKELEDKIDEMDYSAKLAAKHEKEEVSPSTLCGAWHFHDSSSRTIEQYDITIKENEGYYSVEYVILREKEVGGEKYNDTRWSGDITVNDGVISFSTIHSFGLWKVGWKEQVTDSKLALEYSLRLENGKLKGVAKKTQQFDAHNAYGYRTVKDAVEAGAAKIINDCSGDCGTITVFFTR